MGAVTYQLTRWCIRIGYHGFASNVSARVPDGDRHRYMSESILEVEEAIDGLCDLLDRDEPVTEIATQAMEIGISYLDVENGHLTNIVADTDHWEIIASTDPSDGPYSVRRIGDLHATFCRHTLQRDEILAIHDIQTEGWANDIAAQHHELGCYLGIPISVDGNQYGTLCFVSQGARSEPFSDQERQFVELVAGPSSANSKTNSVSSRILVKRTSVTSSVEFFATTFETS